jgi:hypothetical protein
MRFEVYSKDGDFFRDTKTNQFYKLSISGGWDGSTLTAPDHLVEKIVRMLNEEERAAEEPPKGCRLAKSPCPVCGSKWIRMGGTCPTCGMSKHGGEWPGERG